MTGTECGEDSGKENRDPSSEASGGSGKEAEGAGVKEEEAAAEKPPSTTATAPEEAGGLRVTDVHTGKDESTSDSDELRLHLSDVEEEDETKPCPMDIGQETFVHPILPGENVNPEDVPRVKVEVKEEKEETLPPVTTCEEMTTGEKEGSREDSGEEVVCNGLDIPVDITESKSSLQSLVTASTDGATSENRQSINTTESTQLIDKIKSESTLSIDEAKTMEAESVGEAESSGALPVAVASEETSAPADVPSETTSVPVEPQDVAAPQAEPLKESLAPAAAAVPSEVPPPAPAPAALPSKNTDLKASDTLSSDTAVTGSSLVLLDISGSVQEPPRVNGGVQVDDDDFDNRDIDDPEPMDVQDITLQNQDESGEGKKEGGGGGVKRRADVLEASEALKKTRLDPAKKGLYDLYLGKSFKGLTRHSLEELISQKFLDMLVNRGPQGELRHKVAQLEDDYHRLNKLNNSLRKQLQDAKHIIKRLMEEREVQKRTGRVATPLRVTRSVGLQVCTTGTFYMRSKAEFRQMSNDKVIDLDCETFSGPNSNPEETRLATPKPIKAEPPPTRPSPAKVIIERAAVPSSTPPKSSVPQTGMARKDTSGMRALAGGQPRFSPAQPANKPSLEISQVKPVAKCRVVQAAPVTTASSVQHYLIAAPVKTVAVTNTSSPQITQNGSNQNGRLAEKKSQNSSSAMEVIDLTDKDEKAGPVGSKAAQPTTITVSSAPLQNGKLSAPSLSYMFPAQPVSAMNQPSHLKLAQVAQKTQDVVAVKEMPKSSGKVISVVGNEKQGVATSQKAAPSGDDKTERMSASALAKLPPLPAAPKYGIVPAPPRPFLRICKSSAGIMLSWNFGNHKIPTEIATFELFAYQERREWNVPKVWNKVGQVKALPLPMACTLTQFVEGQKYHFAVRAIDIHNRIGEFSSPGSIMLTLSGQ